MTLKTGLCYVLGSVNGSVKLFKYADDKMNQPWEQMTKEMITDFWDGGAHYSPQQAERVYNSIFLGTIIFDTSKYQPYNQQDTPYGEIFAAAVASVFTLSVTVWYNTTAYDRKQLERAFHTASKEWAVIFYLWPPSTLHKISHKTEKVEVLRLSDTITSPLTNPATSKSDGSYKEEFSC